MVGHKEYDISLKIYLNNHECWEKVVNNLDFAKYLEEKRTKNVCNALKSINKK